MVVSLPGVVVSLPGVVVSLSGVIVSWHSVTVLNSSEPVGWWGWCYGGCIHVTLHPSQYLDHLSHQGILLPSCSSLSVPHCHTTLVDGRAMSW